MQFYRRVRIYPHGRVAKTLGLYKLLAGSIPNRMQKILSLTKKLVNVKWRQPGELAPIFSLKVNSANTTKKFLHVSA